MGDISIHVPENYVLCPDCTEGPARERVFVPVVANEELKWKCTQCGNTIEAE